jgi:uncharacterized protein (TIGR00369 family)
MTDSAHTAALTEGFAPMHRHGAFAGRMGPLYCRQAGDGGFEYALPVDERHTNPNGIVHGGALYSFADHLLGHAIVHRLQRGCATVKLKVEFVNAVRPGQLVRAACEIVRATRTMAFVRARLATEGGTVMTADGCFKLTAPFDPERMAAHTPGETSGAAPETPTSPEGFKPFRLQGNFAAVYGPMYYRQSDEGGYVCGFHSTAGHDNTTGAVHGGALFAFADDLIGRAVSATTRRHSATIALDAQYLAPAPLDAWFEGRAEIQGIEDDMAFVRTLVTCGERAILTADGVWRLFRPYA